MSNTITTTNAATCGKTFGTMKIGGGPEVPTTCGLASNHDGLCEPVSKPNPLRELLRRRPRSQAKKRASK
jgi:hypothetical protein